MVVDEVDHARPAAGGGRRLLPAVGAGEPGLLVVEVLALGVGAGGEGFDLVAVGVLGDGEGADRGGPMGLRACVGVGVVVGGLRHAGDLLGLLGDVVDRVVALAERVGGGAGAAAEAPVRGDQPVEVVIGVGGGPRPADGVAEAAAGAVGVGYRVLDLRDVADRIVAEEEVVEGVAARRRRRLQVGEALGGRVVGVGGDGAGAGGGAVADL